MPAIVWDNIRPTDAAYIRGRTEGRVGVDGRSPYQQGLDAERDLIVAWLRRDAPTWSEPDVALAIADAIEGGEYLRPSRPPESADSLPAPEKPGGD